MARILTITNMYPSNKYPHYGVFVRNTNDTLIKHGHHVDTVALSKYDNKLMKLIGYIVFYSKSIFKGIFGHYDYLYGHYISHVSLPIRMICKFNKNIKVVLNAHGNDVVLEEEWMYKNKINTSKVLPLCNTLVVPSLYFKQVMIDDYQYQGNIVVYPSGGVDLDVFKAVDKKEALRYLNLEDQHYIGYISRIEHNKGYDVFLKMASMLEGYKFIVVGQGDKQEHFDKLIQEYKLSDKVIQFPLLAQDKLKYVYSVLDYYIFPTMRVSESLGLVGLEAMACRSVVIASDCYGPTSYMKDHINGYTFKHGDAADLCKVIQSLQDNDLSSIKEEAYHTAKEYEKEHVSKMILEVFK